MQSQGGPVTVLCLDTSGSMAGSGIRQLKEACMAFLDGVENNGMNEAIGIVEFGKREQCIVPITSNYAVLRNAVHALGTGGSTPMEGGLINSLREILQRGYVVPIGDQGHALTPRIVLMTDGKPTHADGEIAAKNRVLAAAVMFGPRHAEAKLPFSVPIACVGCGECDDELLGAIARITNGMYRRVGQVGELTQFFRQQALLMAFAARFANDMSRLTSMLALREFMQQAHENVTEEEVIALLVLLRTMLRLQQAGGELRDIGEKRACLARIDFLFCLGFLILGILGCLVDGLADHSVALAGVILQVIGGFLGCFRSCCLGCNKDADREKGCYPCGRLLYFLCGFAAIVLVLCSYDWLTKTTYGSAIAIGDIVYLIYIACSCCYDTKQQFDQRQVVDNIRDVL